MLLSDIKQDLEVNGFNPITGEYYQRTDYEVDPNLPWVFALKKASTLIKVADRTLKDINNVILQTQKISKALGFNDMRISAVCRRHMKSVLNHAGSLDGTFSPHRYNKFRTYYLILFSELCQLEAIEHNSIKEIKKPR